VRVIEATAMRSIESAPCNLSLVGQLGQEMPLGQARRSAVMVAVSKEVGKRWAIFGKGERVSGPDNHEDHDG